MKKTMTIDPKKMMELELELAELKEQHGIKEERKWWHYIGDFIAARTKDGPITVNRKKYICFAASCGWFCGAHQFYAKRYILGVLYILFFWTAIPFAMTLIDLMIALPKVANEDGIIEL